MKIKIHSGYASRYFRIVRNPGVWFIDLGRHAIEVRFGVEA